MALWISRRFSHCTVLVGDSIHRITLQSTRSLDSDSARREALRLGRDFIAERRHVLDVYQRNTEFTFLPCSEVQGWGAYARYFQELRALYDRDRAFRDSVEAFGRRYHDKRSGGLSAPDLEHRIRMSAQYFLEEFAVFCCLRRRGIPVMVYPGSFSSLSEIANGEHGGAPRELCDLTVVSLHLKGR